MKKTKGILYHIFIEGLSGMALGLFATLIVGTIVAQIGGLLSGASAPFLVSLGGYVSLIGKMAQTVTGAGIGAAVAHKRGASPLVIFSAAAVGMVGAFASQILAGTFLVDGVVHLSGPGEPLGAFLAAYTAIVLGQLVSGKTKIDILVTPLTALLSGSAIGLIVGPPISRFMVWVGSIINWGAEQQPFLVGLIVSVLMGMALTLPISSAALGIILNLSGIAAGAATVGCCCNMVGFAVASYRENKLGGLLAQGLGTSMLQISNIVKKPVIWLPVILSSAVLGPISTIVFRMENNAAGSGMGTSGLVGPLMTWQTMSGSMPTGGLLGEILLLQFILPAALTLLFSELMRKAGIIKPGDMKLDL